MPCLCIILVGFPAGGFKLWECALDLCDHLCNAFDIKATQEQWSSKLPHGTRVLELGCGHGLPGILMMLAGCDVHFQASGLKCDPVASQANSENFARQSCVLDCSILSCSAVLIADPYIYSALLTSKWSAGL